MVAASSSAGPSSGRAFQDRSKPMQVRLSNLTASKGSSDGRTGLPLSLRSRRGCRSHLARAERDGALLPLPVHADLSAGQDGQAGATTVRADVRRSRTSASSRRPSPTRSSPTSRASVWVRLRHCVAVLTRVSVVCQRPEVRSRGLDLR